MNDGENSEITVSFKEEKSKINAEMETLKTFKKSNRRWTIIWLTVVIITIIERIFFSGNASIWQSIISISGLVISLFGLIMKSSNFDKNQKMQRDLQYRKIMIDDEVFLNDIKELNQEERALRQLTKSQNDLEKYHELNLAHTKMIFGIGVIIIFIGIFIICGTLIMAFGYRNLIDNVLITSGFIAGILVDFIGGLFITMYRKTIDSANKYQANLVETTSTYLGNVLVSQIKNQDLREHTLSDMAKELVDTNQTINKKST